MQTSQNPTSVRHSRSAWVILAILLLSAAPALAQTATVAPSPKFTGLDSNGNPIAAGKLCTYAAGSSTAATTYADSTLGVSNTNPVILDSAGRADVWLLAGQTYKFVLRAAGSDTTCATGTIQWTVDNVGAVPASTNNLDILGTAGQTLTAGQAVYLSDGTGSLTAGSWYAADADASYSSTTVQIGFVPNAITTGTAGTIRIGGIITGLSGLTIGAPYYISSTAGAIASTPSVTSNTRRVGVADTTSSLLIDSTYQGDTYLGSVATGTQNNWAPGIFLNTFIVWGGASDLTVTGLANGVTGQRITFRNTTTDKVAYFSHASGSSSVGNRFSNTATTGLTPVAPGGHVTYIFNGTFWMLVDHEQGAWITPTFSAADYTASTGTWGVDALDVAGLSYRLSGLTLEIVLSIATSDVSAAPATLIRAMPGGYTAAAVVLQLTRVSDAGGASAVGMVTASGATLVFYATVAGAGWTMTASDNTSVEGRIVTSVQ